MDCAGGADGKGCGMNQRGGPLALARAAAVALGSSLLFLVQPIAGRLLLPSFGGTPAVWTTCLLFFQAALVGGYLYAHACARLRTRGAQVLVHMLLLAVSAFVAFPRAGELSLVADEAPTWRILLVLARGVGLPFLALAATSPLLQHWAGLVEPGRSPYRLYALSNLGSLAALLAYPFVVEPRLGLAAQTRLWTHGYRVFAVLCAAAAVAVARSAGRSQVPGPAALRDTHRSGAAAHVFWGALAAAGSLMLVATTHQICQDVVVVPLLWIVPLAIYLASFALCFEYQRLYVRGPWLLALGAAVAQSTFVLFRGVGVPIVWQVASCSATLLAACMVCHGELARSKPAAAGLTGFYLAVAIGGALGGAFCTLAAPRLFAGYWEYHCGLVLVCVLALAACFRDGRSRLCGGRPLWAWSGLYAAVSILVIALAVQAAESRSGAIEISRSFYGVLRVLDQDAGNPSRRRTTLMHGRIEHGYQFRDAERRYWPTTYYGPRSGVGVAIRLHPRRARRLGPLRVGVVGLGAGTIATYGERGDTFRFYELNPDVVRLAARHFSYTRLTDARVDVAVGDARVTLERERRAGRRLGFDVLVVDAFSGDAVPVHLLTRECFDLYLHHLDAEGVVALHVSSRYLDLRPVVLGLAAGRAAGGSQALWVASDGSAGEGTDASDWVLVTRNAAFLGSRELAAAVKPWPEDLRPIAWSDDHSDLFRVLQR